MEFINVEREPRIIPEKFRFPNLLKQSRFYDTGSGEWVTMEEILAGWNAMPEEDKAEYATMIELSGELAPCFGLYLENCMLFNGGMLELEEDQLAFEAELEDILVEEYEASHAEQDSSDLLDYLEFIEDSRHYP